MISSLDIAQTIMNLLGGKATLVAAFGASELMALKNGLQIRLGDRGKKGIIKVRVVLTEKDNYTVKCYGAGRGMPLFKNHPGVECAQLRKLFEKLTGVKLIAQRLTNGRNSV